MAWAYVFAMIAWAFIPGVKRSGKLVVPLVLILGILPDSNLFLSDLGIVHRTVTHSFLLWIIVFIPLFVALGLKSIPYFVAVVQHFAFGDLLMGKVMIFWPFSKSFVGVNFTMPSLVDVSLEIAGLLLATAIILYSNDLRRMLSVDKRNILMAVPLLALGISALFFASHWPSLNGLIAYVSSTKTLTVLALGHIILFSFLAVSALQGLRALRSKPTAKSNLDSTRSLS